MTAPTTPATARTLPGRLLQAYRATGADLPFGDPRDAHGVAMEGYFWRFTQPDTGRVVLALNGVNRAEDGHWATLGLASHPNGFLRTTVHDEGAAAPVGIGAHAGSAFRGEGDRLTVDLGPDARLDVHITEPVPWPRRRWGGSSVFQSVPALNQYWHPWLLGGRAQGSAVLGGERWDLDGAQVYAEKNWGRGGFPDSWWWGQAQAFAEPQVCVAFAGGQVTAGPLHTEVTALVVLLPDGTLVRLGDPVVSPVRAEVSDERWLLHGRSLGWSVDVDASSPLHAAHVLPVPLPAERRNVPGAIEHLGGRMRVRVKRRGRLVWEGESALAALEHGSIDRAAQEVARRGGVPGATGAPPGPSRG
ncbi:tocopherol cyclase family protein [Rhodococcus sp. X156]|uniref:tocopherol cyclase family protein n=1 Tax=Rhodococcus sp. X156 TaxID=2499145 RepID=UPI000FDAC89C|nr:tocopherol cyclase family protein [Rhodococcus sp. X156]